MYYFVAGFVCGVYVGTRYDLEPYVLSVEERFVSFAEDMQKRKRERENQSDASSTYSDSVASSIRSFFSSEKK